MDFFEEIAKVKEDFPKINVNSLNSEVKKYKFNFYQIFAIILLHLML